MMVDNSIIKYFIDANNLIGKIPKLRKLKGSDSRERLIFLLQRFFSGKKVNVTLFFDGHQSENIKTNFEIVYSLNRSADELIKQRIDRSKRNKNLVVVSSDLEIFAYAKECGCKAVKSEEFYKNISSTQSDDLTEKPNNFDIDEFKKIFKDE
jgi:predicted RNA-binding protein with PIN domain